MSFTKKGWGTGRWYTTEHFEDPAKGKLVRRIYHLPCGHEVGMVIWPPPHAVARIPERVFCPWPETHNHKQRPEEDMEDGSEGEETTDQARGAASGI